MMRCACSKMAVAAVGALCFLSSAVLSQGIRVPAKGELVTITAPPKPTGETPRTPDGHPDLTGLWNGMSDNLDTIANQIYNDGISIEGPHLTHDINDGAKIATWPVSRVSKQNDEQYNRAGTLMRRVGSSLPIYKPQYWEMVQDLDTNANDEDPTNGCLTAGVPREGMPSYIVQDPTHIFMLYPGQGHLFATQTSYRMISLDKRKHTPLEDLDGSDDGESIAHWDGDTLVLDTWGFNATSWFGSVGGYFHSDNMHVIERFQRDGNILTWTATVDDPDVLLEPWTMTPRVALLNPDPHAVLPKQLACSDRSLGHYGTKEHH
jgi:hypothetical protein